MRNTMQKKQKQLALLQMPDHVRLVMWEPDTGTGVK